MDLFEIAKISTMGQHADMDANLLPEKIRKNYVVKEYKHSCAVLKQDYPEQWNDIMSILGNFKLKKSDILSAGGGLSKISSWFNLSFKEKKWQVHSFDTKIIVDDKTFSTPTHEVDCVKGEVALEIEWSNKDPFFDRDLNNFRLLFDLRAISVGVIITKADELSDVFKSLGKEVWDKYGWSTTWMKKLIPRIEGGGGGGCPILVFGIKKQLYLEDE